MMKKKNSLTIVYRKYAISLYPCVGGIKTGLSKEVLQRVKTFPDLNYNKVASALSCRPTVRKQKPVTHANNPQGGSMSP